jgi:hypothetical protein
MFETLVLLFREHLTQLDFLPIRALLSPGELAVSAVVPSVRCESERFVHSFAVVLNSDDT